MRVVRLTRERYKATALLGIGARLTEGRWHSAGTAIAYTAGTPEVALLEALMHVDIDDLPADYILVTYEVPDDAIEELNPLPLDWDAMPPYQPAVQAAGDEWVRSGRSLGLRVPSSVFPLTANLLINPQHSRFAEIREVADSPWRWPPRLIAELQGPR